MRYDFFTLKNMGYMLMSAILAFSTWLPCVLLFGPRIQLKWTQFDEEVMEDIISFFGRGGGSAGFTI
jgi:hypothetical protein